MYKVLWNNMIVDLLREACYIRYLPRQARAIVVDKGNANGIMGSDKNTMYHLAGTQSTFTEGIKTVEVVPVSAEEFEVLSQQQAKTQQLDEKIKTLEDLITKQNDILAKLAEKL